MKSEGRKRSRVSYQDDDDDEFEAEMILEYVPEGSTVGAATVQPVVEKVLGRKYVIIPEDGSVDAMYLIKWRGLSYIHASWEFRNAVETIDQQGKTKLKRFDQSHQSLAVMGDPSKPEVLAELGSNDDEDAEYYNPEYAEVHRVISCDSPSCVHAGCSSLADMESMSTESLQGEVDVYYLVKWRGMQYNECTWERWEDIKDYSQEIFEFWQRQRPPTIRLRSLPHPSLQEYQQLVVSPKFGILDDATDDADDQGLTLRDYQLEGVNWLLWNWWHKRPCILADEMGLGKTIQTVCFLHQLQHMPATQVCGPFLVVGPLSLIQQWQNEIGLWSPQMNCVVLHGSAQSRQLILENEFYYQEPFTPKAEAATLRKKNIVKFDVLLSTYEIAMKEIKVLSKIQWKVLIVDEAHRLKNQASRLFEAMQTIPRDQCVLLTGTPLQNKTEELWALLHFADSSKFSNQMEFVSRFGDLRDSSDVAGLHTLLKPYLLRRVKEDVEKSLPPKEETIIEVALTTLQKQFYRAIYEKNTQFLFKGARSNNQPSLMNVMMELRKCCNHPFLIKGVEDRVISELPIADRTDDVIHQKMVMCAGKMVLLDKLLPRLFAEGHKVLIFSQMVKVLNIIEDYIRWKGYQFERLDGSTRASDRHVAVERFCRPSLKRFIMLLSTKAGGLGLNLTSADTVIIFDSDWNPHNDIQAQARAHRIGQTKAVMVYRLLTRKTYEMHMFHRASLKLGLDRAVLAHARNEQEGDDDSGSTSVKDGLQAKEIDELLKRGAYDIFRDDDTEQTEFVEADIDAIMQRSAHKISYEGVTTSSISNTLGGFAKATFVSADEKEDVDINDPDFWKKAVGLDEPAAQADNPFLENLPLQRKRKQTQVFGEQTVSDQKELDDMLKEELDEESTPVVVKEKAPKKKAAEPKPKEPKESKPWGPHSRDRVLRALLQFGFGRWAKIRKESGASQRSLADVEHFVRSFMMQCGLCAGETGSIKGDTEFVREAINAAQRVDGMVKRGEREPLKIPPILQNEKFVSKLKLAGRKMLQKLDLLAKLNSMVGESIAKVYAECPDIEQSPTLDEAVMDLPRDKVLVNLPLGTVRPAWTRPRSWWDLECDRQLVLGIFLYGYGRYNEVRDDQTFVFHVKLKDWLAPTAFMSRVITKIPETEVEDDPKFPVVSGDTKIECSTEYVVSHFKTPCGREGRVYLPCYRYSEYKGVYSQPGSVKWMAQYGDDKSSMLIGTFDSEVEAALAYDNFARTKEGETAVVNFDTANDGQRTVYEVDKSKRPNLPWHRASKYRGVRASGAKWTAQISYDGTNHHLGTFTTEIEAAMAYDCAARDHHGPSAVSNFSGNAERVLMSMSREVGVTVEFGFARASCGRETAAVVRAVGRSAETVAELKEESAMPMEEPAAAAELATTDHNADDSAGTADKLVHNGQCAESLESVQKIQTSPPAQTCDRSSVSSATASSATSPMLPPDGTGASEVDNDGEEDEEDEKEGDNGSDLGEGDADNDADNDKVDEDDNEKEGGANSSGTEDADAMPDARVLNRLFAWLVTSEQARMTKAQQEQRNRANKKARQLEMAGKKEEKAKQQAEEDRRTNIQLGEKGILSLGAEQFDADAQQFVHKKVLLRKCEAVLRKPVSPAGGGQSGRPDGSVADDTEYESSIATDTAGENGEDRTQSAAEVVEGRFADNVVKRLCCALLLFGAPFWDSKLPLPSKAILTQIGMPTIGLSVPPVTPSNDKMIAKEDGGDYSDMEEAEEGAEMTSPVNAGREDYHIQMFSWEALASYAGVDLSVEQLHHFYTHEWLPFCVAISKAQTFSHGPWIPNPYIPPTSHNIASKGLCSVFIFRQRQLRAIRYVLSRHMADLVVYLRTNACIYTDSTIPVWWCPWIHDVALMVGCLKHGYMALEQICRDEDLPFTADHLLVHIKRAFLFGSGNTLPAAWGIFRCVEEAERWAQCASLRFPDQKCLESRLAKILADMTKHLTVRHMCRINVVGNGEENMVDKDGATAMPLAPLNRFLEDSAKRRRLYVVDHHANVL